MRHPRVKSSGFSPRVLYAQVWVASCFLKTLSRTIGELFNYLAMKKLFPVLLIVAAAATAFSCSKIEKVAPVKGEVHTVTFNASTPSTKTTFGDRVSGTPAHYPTHWTTNDSEVKVAQNFSGGLAAAVTKDSDTNASFTADFEDDGSGSYTFYAISPASAVVSGVNSTYYSWNLQIPTTQTSTATGPDESAMILAATSSTEDTFPTNVNLSFKHITAYAKMSITNLDLESGDEVASVLVSADANIAYRYYYYVGGTKKGTLEASNGQNAITILTTSPSNIWFACAPMAAGTKLTIAVTTKNSKVYTKENITTPAALAAGHVATFNVNFSGITPPSDKVYNLVTSYSELTAGSKVIIAAVGDSDYAAGIGTTSSNFITAVSQAKSADDSKITNPAATVDVFTIEAGGTANTIALNGTNGYLYAKSTSSNYMGIQTTNNVDGYWTPTIVDPGTGEMSLVATGSSNRNYMHYNGDRFSCYASTSSVTALQALYKLEGSGSGPSLFTTYTITYDGNGNTGGSAPAAFETTGAFTVAAAGTLEKTGFSFTGWNTAADGSGTPYAAGADAVATADVTLYAQWEVAGSEHTSTLTFTAACGGSGTADDGAAWTVTSDADESVFDSTHGVHYGTNSKSVQYVQLSTSDISGTIKSVVVTTRDAQATATVSVTVGGTAFTCSGSTTATNSSVPYTFTGSKSGNIVVRVDRGSAQTKAIYVKSVVVTYTD